MSYEEPLRVDVGAVAHTAGVLLDESFGLADAVTPVLSQLDLDPRFLGTPDAAQALARAHQSCLDDVGAVLAGLREVLEADAERFYQLAFALNRAERAASTHVTLEAGTTPP